MIVYMDSVEVEETIAAVTYKMEKLHEVKRNDSVDDDTRAEAATDYDILSLAREQLREALKA